MRDLTTGQVAKVTGLSVRTVIIWCDRGMLRYWTIPQSKNRRIKREDLIEFAKKHEMPLNWSALAKRV